MGEAISDEDDVWVKLCEKNFKLGTKEMRIPLKDISLDTAIHIALANELALIVRTDCYIFSTKK